ncbi:Outer membrane protein OmpA [Pseudooceanicola antarcticus]|uniref:OmpA family protein n=1 Tax=Pseudooceanicola antarcticus TaxID=1247613 RepID=A0A285ISQ3_9RHOB|nr:OmpA family protein [Pseudooceanicola antarcticus]PJE31960.1 OmpA family protein [Pseudooceanicola antarcticus]SNY51022.1 Outer membrane protein OmpA [Pseudooceanicola antarcticus]
MLIRKLPALLALGALTACTTDGYSTFTREAGALVDRGDFGNATMNNQLVQSGRKSYVENLNQRFTQDVPTTINFAFNSWQLDTQARAVLTRQATWIKQFPEVRFRVYGHTDLVGSNAYNKRLGLRRAQVAVNFLVAQGIGRDRLEAVASFGETQPLVYSQGPERENRRTVTEVTGFVKRHPNVMDGKYAAIVYRGYVESAVVPSTLTGGSLTSGGGSE